MDIPLKNKSSVLSKDFRAFRTKIFVRSIIMLLASVLGVYFLYSVILRGRFADFMVSIFQNAFFMDYNAACNLYQQVFRNHQDLLIIIALASAFLITFRIYLNWFTKYFEEIDKGMDGLIKEDAEEISLSPELLPMERKLNTVKHTI